MGNQNIKLYMDAVISVVGDWDSISGDDYDFWCPFCKSKNLGHLHINFIKKKALCHKCGYAAGNLIKLFQDLKIEDVELYTGCVGNAVDFIKGFWDKNKNKKIERMDLPEEYQVLRVGATDVISKMYIGYLRYRGMTDSEIKSIPMGYCNSGKYDGRLVFPTYMYGKLVYFTTRAAWAGSPKSLHPDCSYKRKILYGIDWLLDNDHIFLVEGVFDTLAFRNKSLAVFGHFVTPEQAKVLRKLNPKEITVCFDTDVENDVIMRICKFLSQNTEATISFMDLDEGDPFDNRHTIQRFIDRRIVYNQRQSLHNKLQEVFNDKSKKVFGKF